MTFSNAALASGGLPNPVGDQVQNGDYIAWFRKQFGDAYTFLAESASMVTFFVVATAIILTFVGVINGKKEWKDLFVVAGTGAVILIVVFFLFNEGDGIVA